MKEKKQYCLDDALEISSFECRSLYEDRNMLRCEDETEQFLEAEA